MKERKIKKENTWIQCTTQNTLPYEKEEKQAVNRLTKEKKQEQNRGIQR